MDTLSTGGRPFIIVGDFNRRRMRYDDYERRLRLIFVCVYYLLLCVFVYITPLYKCYYFESSLHYRKELTSHLSRTIAITSAFVNFFSPSLFALHVLQQYIIMLEHSLHAAKMA